MGKTRLSARFAAEAHAGGAAVLHGRIDEETVVPYQPFVEAHAPLRGPRGRHQRRRRRGARAARAGAGRHGAGVPGERENRRYRLFEAVAALLGQAAGERGRCCSWSRTSSGRAARRCCCSATSSAACTAAPLMVLVTLRDAEADPGGAAGAAARRPQPRARRRARSRSTGLDEAEAAELVGDAELARTPPRTAPPATRSSSRRCCAASRRRPTSRPACPRASRTSSRAGSRGCSPTTVETLTAAAVLGRDFRSPRSRRWLARPGEELLGPLEEALRASVVREDAEHVDRFAFAHALVRETLYDAPAARPPRAPAPARRPGARGRRRAARRARPPLLRGARGRRRRRRGRAQRRRRRARPWRRTPTRRRRGTSSRRSPPQARRAAARAELLLALGDVRWQASEPGARRRVRRGRRRSPAATARPTALARAVLGAGGRFYMPTAPTPPTSRGSRRRSPRSATPTARCARGCSPGSPSTSRSPTPATARPRSAPRRWRWRARGGDDGALAAALMGRHAALLDIEHVEERLAVIDEALAIAERLGAGRARRARPALAHLRPRRARPTSPTRSSRTRASQTLARELHQPLYTHAALAWRGESGAPRRAARGGRADRARVAADRRGGRRARGARLLPHPDVRRPARPGAAGRAARADRAAGPPARARSASCWRATLPLVLLAGGRARARARRLRRRARRRRCAACRAASSASAGSSASPRRAPRSATPAAPTSLIACLEPHADRLAQTALQRLLGLGPALPRPARAPRPPATRARTRGRARARARARPSPELRHGELLLARRARAGSSCSPRRHRAPPAWPARRAADVSGERLGAL